MNDDSLIEEEVEFVVDERLKREIAGPIVED